MTDREPPPMVPSAEERARAITEGAGAVGFTRGVSWGLSAAYRDGWNAAQARIAELEAEVARLRPVVDASRDALRAFLYPESMPIGPSGIYRQRLREALDAFDAGNLERAPDANTGRPPIVRKGIQTAGPDGRDIGAPSAAHPVRRDWCEEHNRGSLADTDGLCPECEARTAQRKAERAAQTHPPVTEDNRKAALSSADALIGWRDGWNAAQARIAELEAERDAALKFRDLLLSRSPWPEDEARVSRVSDAICAAMASYMAAPLHRDAYLAAARAAVDEADLNAGLEKGRTAEVEANLVLARDTLKTVNDGWAKRYGELEAEVARLNKRHQVHEEIIQDLKAEAARLAAERDVAERAAQTRQPVTEDDREAAEKIAAEIDVEHDDTMQADCAVCKRVIPFIASAIAAARAEGRREGIEAAIAVIRGGYFLSDDAPVMRWAREVIAAIRRTLAAPEPQKKPDTKTPAG